MSFFSRRPVVTSRPGSLASAVVSLVTFLLVAAQPALAQTDFVKNGNFAVTGGNTSFQFGTYGPYTPTETLANWSSPNGYNFVCLPTSTVATSVYGNLSLWSPVSSPASANGFNNAGPTGGNFIGADAAFGQAAISQTITGLTVGKTYKLSFAWAGAQQSGFTAVNGTTENWAVTFAGVTQTTPTITVANMGFSGWMNQTFNFVATSATDTLSFFATGTPTGVPPFALLATVSMVQVQVPEPASMAILLTGIAGLAGLVRGRRGPAAAANRVG